MDDSLGTDEKLLDWECLMVWLCLLGTFIEHLLCAGHWAQCWGETGRSKLPFGAYNPLGRGNLKLSNRPKCKQLQGVISPAKETNKRQRE